MKAPEVMLGSGPLRRAQRGVALISALLLLMVVTILALSMFRSFPTQEKIAGNVREKERAFHAANSALQFAEYWLLANVASGDSICGAEAPPLPNGFLNEGSICSNPLYGYPNQTPGLITSVTAVPWIVGGGTAANVGTQYTPNGMTIQPSTGMTTTANNDTTYYSAPVYYIADLGVAGDGQGEAYQIDAYAYAGSANTIAVVESIYEVAQGVVNRTGE
jgi:type IV pilus assembly protein PilX